MDIRKADYDTIIRFGSIDDFEKKLLDDGCVISDIVNSIDSRGVSLLQKA